MSIFNVLQLIGGLSLFLFGMTVMGQALERRAGGGLRSLLGKLTTKKAAGVLTGLGVTAVIQSSSATTVMVVGFVNSGLMTLRQSIHVIMGANVGTTVTAWVLSLTGIRSDNLLVSLFKPSSFTPVLALIGVIFLLFCKESRKKDTGTILLGFATLMYGMESMSGAVAGLQNVPAFTNLFLLFRNPLLGVLAGAVLTAIIQSSSASVGILQALAVTGQVTYGAAIPIIMGQNIGTCITALLSAVGANKNAKRAALVHLSFNIIGTGVWLIVFCLVKALIAPALLDEPASLLGIAVTHSAFNILCTLLLLPMAGLLEKLACYLIPDDRAAEHDTELDERLLATPPIALNRCHEVTSAMASVAMQTLQDSLTILTNYTPAAAEAIREKETLTDHYEDELGTYLVKLSSCQISEADSREAAKLLKMIGDFERIGDHAVNLLESAEELHSKKIVFTDKANAELQVLVAAVEEILTCTLNAYRDDDPEAASMVEPLEQVIDGLKEQLRIRHILRLQQQACSIDAGFIWSDLLTNLERVADHCSNIAGCIIDTARHNMNMHETLREYRHDSEDFRQRFNAFAARFSLAECGVDSSNGM